MALQCQLTLSTRVYVPGQTPTPTASLLVYNPNAFAVTVTGVQIFANNPYQNGITAATGGDPLVAIGPGQTTTVPALSSITIAPIYLAAGWVGNGNSFAEVLQAGNTAPINTQLAQRLQGQFLLSAVVSASDGSRNFAGQDSALVSYYPQPPIGFQGGALNFAGPNNFVTGFLSGFF